MFRYIVLIYLAVCITGLPQYPPEPEIEDDAITVSSMEDYDLAQTPRPFQFGFQHVDEYGNAQHREEVADGTGAVRGSYGYTDNEGFYRHVSYVADKGGFHAVVRTNEPGIANMNSADVAVVAGKAPAKKQDVV